MGTLPHRIFRQKWQVNARSEEEAFGLRKQIREGWEENIVPIFERVFNEHSNGDEILYIPKLEFNLKVTGDSDLWETIREELYHQLSDIIWLKEVQSESRNLYNQGSDIPWSKESQFKGRHSYNQFSEVPGSGQPLTADLLAGESAMIRIPAKQYHLEVLFHYLLFGNLPWQENRQANEASAELLAAIREHMREITDYLHNYKVPHAFLFRLFQFLSDNEIILLSKDLCNHLSFSAKEELNNLIAALLQSGENDLNPHARKELLAVFVEAGIGHHPTYTIPDWFCMAENLVSSEKLDQLRKYCTMVPENPLLVASDRRCKQDKMNPAEGLKKIGFPLVNFIEEKKTTADFMGLQGLEELFPKAGQFVGYPGLEENLSTKESRKDFPGSFPYSKLQEGVRFMAPNAGLLLLHPFLIAFFNQTGILALNEKEIPQNKLANAAALLHFLATGREEVYEFELGFIKLLLGFDPDQPLIVSGGTLSKDQKEETESLLVSVLGHWTAMKNTSAVGLQTTFIQRPAMIFETDEGWKVQPEGKSYDLLLNTIPWGFSTIKLPWMNKPIFTEWQPN